MSLNHILEEIVTKHLPDDSHFLVDIHLVEKGTKPQLKVLIDSDQGVSIENCALVSRLVGEEIEAKGLLPDAYILEVSSPGVDFPLDSKRQYTKNIGRNLKVTYLNGKEIEGKLLEVGSSEIKLVVKTKEKGKKAQEQEINVPFEQIKKSIVLVSFK